MRTNLWNSILAGEATHVCLFIYYFRNQHHLQHQQVSQSAHAHSSGERCGPVEDMASLCLSYILPFLLKCLFFHLCFSSFEQTSFVLSHFSSRHHLASHFSHFLLSPPPPDVCIKSPDFSAHSLTVNRKWLTWISILLYEAELLSSLQLCCWKPSCW